VPIYDVEYVKGLDCYVKNWISLGEGGACGS
jgi:hypothetical protein